jgi:putative hydrolase of the HAD superfamily
MSTNSISTVIFDLGRVCVNIDFEAFPNALELLTAEARAPYQRAVAVHAHLFETGKISTEEFIDRLFSVFNGRYTREHLLHAWNEIIRDDVPGMLSIISRVQDHHATAMLSNTSVVHFEKAERDCSTVRQITRRFLSFEVGVAKPAPEIYEHVIRELGAEPARLLFIDDLAENVEAAQKAGMNGLIFTDPGHLEAALVEWNILPVIPPNSAFSR